MAREPVVLTSAIPHSVLSPVTLHGLLLDPACSSPALLILNHRWLCFLWVLTATSAPPSSLCQHRSEFSSRVPGERVHSERGRVHFFPITSVPPPRTQPLRAPPPESSAESSPQGPSLTHVTLEQAHHLSFKQNSVESRSLYSTKLAFCTKRESLHIFRKLTTDL